MLVQGTGGVSTAALQLARAGGARAIVVTRGERHAARLRELGASDVVAGGDGADWPAQVLALTGGLEVNAAVDVAGSASLARSISALRVGGRVHQVGYVADTSATLDIFEAIRRGATIHVATAGSRRSFEALVRVMELHAIKPPIAAAFPADQVRDALDHLARGGHLEKVVLAF